MDFTLPQLRTWLERIYCPVILLRTTPDVEESCLKNGFQFIDILRSYEHINKESAYYRFIDLQKKLLLFLLR